MTPALILCAVLVPQAPSTLGGVSAGNFAGTPATLFFTQETIAANYPTNAPAQSNGQFKYSGMQTTPPGDHPVPSSSSVPNFSPGVAPWANQDVVIDAFSTNVNWISIDPTSHEMNAAGSPQGWSALLFTVTSATEGAPNTRIRAEWAVGDVAADVFQYLTPDSTNIVPNPDETYRSLDSSQIRVLGDGEGSDTTNVIALDVSIPFILNSPSVFPELLNGFRGVVFSVTSESASSVPNEWRGVPPAQVSGATVFRCMWSQSTGWGPVQPWLDPDALGLSEEDDVDALAWDLDVLTTPTRPELIMFSTASGTPDPLMYVRVGTMTSHPVKVNRNSQTIPLSQAIGLRPGIFIDDVDGFCALDPRFPNFPRAVGRMGVNTGNHCLHVTCFRTMDTLVSVLSRPVCKLPSEPTWAMLSIRPPGGSWIPIHSVGYDGFAPVQYSWSPPATFQGIFMEIKWDAEGIPSPTLGIVY